MTTIAIVTLCDGDTDLFPFWLEHYRSLGVDHILVCIDRRKCGNIAIPHGIHMHEYWRDGEGEMRDNQERQAILDFAAAQCGFPDWILYTDLDEHQEYQGGLHAALAAADAAGDEIVMGVHCDRLAPDGSFPELPSPGYVGEYGLALDAAFPIRANLSRDVLGIRYVKVMAAKPGVVLRPGRHGTQQHAFAGKRAGILSAGHLVHHFKWRAGIIERIKDRMATLPAEYEWYRRAYRPFVEAVEANGGRIPSEWLCQRDHMGKPNCPCPKCRAAWSQEMEQMSTRLAKQCESECAALQAKGENAVPGPFGIPMVLVDKKGS